MQGGGVSSLPDLFETVIARNRGGCSGGGERHKPGRATLDPREGTAREHSFPIVDGGMSVRLTQIGKHQQGKACMKQLFGLVFTVQLFNSSFFLGDDAILGKRMLNACFRAGEGRWRGARREAHGWGRGWGGKMEGSEMGGAWVGTHPCASRLAPLSFHPQPRPRPSIHLPSRSPPFLPQPRPHPRTSRPRNTAPLTSQRVNDACGPRRSPPSSLAVEEGGARSCGRMSLCEWSGVRARRGKHFRGRKMGVDGAMDGDGRVDGRGRGCGRKMDAK